MIKNIGIFILIFYSCSLGFKKNDIWYYRKIAVYPEVMSDSSHYSITLDSLYSVNDVPFSIFTKNETLYHSDTIKNITRNTFNISPSGIDPNSCYFYRPTYFDSTHLCAMINDEQKTLSRYYWNAKDCFYYYYDETYGRVSANVSYYTQQHKYYNEFLIRFNNIIISNSPCQNKTYYLRKSNISEKYTLRGNKLTINNNTSFSLFSLSGIQLYNSTGTKSHSAYLKNGIYILKLDNLKKGIILHVMSE